MCREKLGIFKICNEYTKLFAILMFGKQNWSEPGKKTTTFILFIPTCKLLL